MRVQCDEAKGTRQQERAQRTDKCLTGHLAPALQAARYTNFLAGLGLTGAAEGVLESHSSGLGQHPCDCGYISFLTPSSIKQGQEFLPGRAMEAVI